MINILEKSVETIKGVGKKYLQTLNELEIYTIRDILYNIPYRVSSSTDFSSSVKDNEKVITTGKVETRVSFMEIEEVDHFLLYQLHLVVLK